MRSVSDLDSTVVSCVLCGHEAANLIKHVQTAHKGVALDAYVLEHGGRLFSAEALHGDKLASLTAPRKPRKRVDKPIRKLFGFRVKEDVPVVAQREAGVVPGNPHYVFPPAETLNLLMFLQRRLGDGTNVYISGPSGSGKTDLVISVADKLNWPISILDCDSHLARSSLLGQHVVRGKEVVFQYGLIPRAMLCGHILLINEYDTINPMVANILKPVLDRQPRLTLLETGEVIEAHPDFRVVATANTFGRGDDTGAFVNTHIQSIADLRRYHGFIKLDYPDADVEKDILMDRFGEGNIDHQNWLEPEEADRMVAVVGKVREAHKAGKIERTMSTAELCSWARTYLDLADIYEAARLTFLNSYTPDVALAVSAMVEEVWGVERKDPPAATGDEEEDDPDPMAPPVTKATP